jgi:hypothetical protein
MPSFKLAHIRQSGQDMLLFPLEGGFGRRTREDQNQALAELEMRAHGAGLAGRAVAFWQNAGRTHFLGPAPWQGFLRSLDMASVLRNVNRTLSW